VTFPSATSITSHPPSLGWCNATRAATIVGGWITSSERERLDMKRMGGLITTTPRRAPWGPILDVDTDHVGFGTVR
jgi:hypothetical protein